MIVAQRARASISRAGLCGGRAEERGEQDAREGGRHDAKAGSTKNGDEAAAHVPESPTRLGGSELIAPAAVVQRAESYQG